MTPYIYKQVYMCISICLNKNNIHQLKQGYALNLNISVSAAQKQKLTRIPLVTASEVGNNLYAYFDAFMCYKYVLSPMINPYFSTSLSLEL